MKEEMTIFLWVLRLFLGAFFVWSGVMKLLDPGTFTESVANFQLVSRPLDAYVAYFLPWLEIFAGAALLSGVFLRGGLLCVAGMMLVFLGALGYAWSQGLNINCGCFGAGGKPVNYPWKMASNAGILLLALVFLRWPGSLRGGEK